MLAPGARRVRLVGTVAAVLLLVAGTAWGQDDHFPFGPFKMYSRATKTTGRVTWLALEGRDTAGRTHHVVGADIGLRRAELEGLMPPFQAEPDLLGRGPEPGPVPAPATRSWWRSTWWRTRSAWSTACPWATVRNGWC